MGAESVILTVTGVFFGTAAGTVPFTVVRTDAVLPDQFFGIRLAMVVVSAAATPGATPWTARQVLRTPAVSAVGSAAQAA
ncbi:hypothetical protein [Streptomyces incanus]|uniref:Uncharacterized protein n=1 Tax=Streptomyces incanus TaxID=887453 RepID=A0ABW0XPZ4_9ACTN